jgi:hypothetical protein
MVTGIAIIHIIIALGIYNVWLVRANRPTAWRGGTAQNLREEFAVYGLSLTTMRLVGAAKLLSATAILVGVWYPPMAVIGAAVLSLLMVAAVLCHYKVHDPSKRALPAACMLALSVIVLVANAGL